MSLKSSKSGQSSHDQLKEKAYETFQLHHQIAQLAYNATGVTEKVQEVCTEWASLDICLDKTQHTLDKTMSDLRLHEQHFNAVMETLEQVEAVVEALSLK